MSIKQKITRALSVQAAESFVETIQNDGGYYVFASKHTPFTSDEDGGTDLNPPIPLDTTRGNFNIYNEMLFGKRVRPGQVTNMIPRNTWTKDTVYDMYTDTEDMANKNFYVTVAEGSNINVYKCLFNNNGAKANVEPFSTSNQVIGSDVDGYLWKYLFTVDDFSNEKFSTVDYIPVVPNQGVINVAKSGSIDIIVVEDGGEGYRNYTVGELPDDGSIRVSNSELKYALSPSASNIKDFYKNCIIKISAGPGATADYRLITEYDIINDPSDTLNNGRKVITIDRPFNENLIGGITKGYDYDIRPAVFIDDLSGSSSDQCIAWATVNPNRGYSISSVEIINSGENYRLASARLAPADDVGITYEAVVKPIVAPLGGHGADVNNELFAKYVGIAASFGGNSAPLVANNDFRTIGVVKDPLFDNVIVDIDSTTAIGLFVENENLLRYRPLQLSGNVSIYSNTTLVGSNSSLFIDTLRTNDKLLITNGIRNVLTNIVSIVNNSIVMVDKQLTDQTELINGSLYLIQGESFGKVVNYDLTQLTVTDTIPKGWNVSSYILGEESGATVRTANNVYNVSIGERNADEFNAFNQLTKLVGSFTTVTRFVQDEVVTQTLANGAIATAVVHSFRDALGDGSDFMYVSSVTNTLEVDNTIAGTTSNAFFTITDKYDGELVQDSGEILYLENTNPIKRNPRQSENIRLILEF